MQELKYKDYSSNTVQSYELRPIEIVQPTKDTSWEYEVVGRKDATRIGRLIRSAVTRDFELKEFDWTSASKFDGPAPTMREVIGNDLESVKKLDKIRPAVFEDPQSRLIRIVYKQIVIVFERGTTDETHQQIMDKFGLDAIWRGKFMPRMYALRHRAPNLISEQLIELSNQLVELPEVEFAGPDFVSEIEPCSFPTPRSDQWHLLSTDPKRPDVDILEAWKQATTTGTNSISVAVLDSGIDLTHPDFNSSLQINPDPSEPLDKFGRDFMVPETHPEHFNPRSKIFHQPFNDQDRNDIHGTACAGLIAANGTTNNQMLGAAPTCQILAVKIFNGGLPAAERKIAEAIAYAASTADIISCSWRASPHNSIEVAISDAVKGLTLNHHRGTLGTPVFAAAGNFQKFVGHKMGTVEYPASLPDTICVGATTRGGGIASYSETGASLGSSEHVIWITAPSSGGADMITTTDDDSAANRGYSIGPHTNSFGGTSAATALVAGIAALILSVRPNLSVDRLKDVLSKGVDKVGASSEYDSDGHSKKFGFGKINARKAVDEALKIPFVGF